MTVERTARRRQPASGRSHVRRRRPHSPLLAVRAPVASRSLADLRMFRALIVLLTVLAALALIYALWQVLIQFAHVLWLLVFAGLLAFIVQPAVTLLEQRHIPRSVAVLGIYVVALGSLGLGIALAVGPLTTQLTTIDKDLPTIINTIDRELSQLHLPVRLAAHQHQILAAIQQQTNSLLSNVVSLLTAVASFVVDLVLVIVISIYLLIDARRIHANVLRLVPERYRDQAFFVEAAVSRVVGGYIRGQLTMALLIGSAYGVGCLVLGVHYPLVIGVLAGLFELIPMVGPVLGAIPALAIALTQSPGLAIWVLAYYVVIQQLESHIVGPRITGRAVGLHPLAAILALAAGVEVDGVVGALLGVPAVGILYVLAMAIYWELQGVAAPLPGERRDALHHARRLLDRRRAPRERGTISPLAATQAEEDPQPPRMLAELGDKAATLRDSFERSEAHPAHGQGTAGGSPSMPDRDGLPPLEHPEDRQKRELVDSRSHG